MPFDSNEVSPCKLCHLKNEPKMVREKQGSCHYQLRQECENCEDLNNYKTKSSRFYMHYNTKTVHEINERAIAEVGQMAGR